MSKASNQFVTTTTEADISSLHLHETISSVVARTVSLISPAGLSVVSYIHEHFVVAIALAMVFAGLSGYYVRSLKDWRKSFRIATAQHNLFDALRSRLAGLDKKRTREGFNEAVKEMFCDLGEKWRAFLVEVLSDASVGCICWLRDDLVTGNNPEVLSRVCSTLSLSSDFCNQYHQLPSDSEVFRVFSHNGNAGVLIIRDFQVAIKEKQWIAIGVEQQPCIKSLMAAPVNIEACASTRGILLVTSQKSGIFNAVDAERVKAAADFFASCLRSVNVMKERLLQPSLFDLARN